MSTSQLSDEVARHPQLGRNLINEIGKVLVGQEAMVSRLLIGLLTGGHVLLEGVPGLAKTLTVRVLAQAIDTGFSRIQFTPDMLPADVIGTEVFNPRDATYSIKKGPIFSNLILADEINRAPAKVQAALLEAMEERQVTVAGTTHPMEPLFMVMATQNPVEQEGTYPLPEAQMDRFLMHVMITYPPVEDEVKVIQLVRGEETAALAPKPMTEAETEAETEARQVISQAAVFDARREIAAIHVAEAMERYMANLVYATRTPEVYSEDLARWIEVGSSPRASLALDKCGRAQAWLSGRDYLDPQDIRAIVHEVLRHRLTLSYEAQGEGVTPDRVIDEILSQVALT